MLVVQFMIFNFGAPLFFVAIFFQNYFKIVSSGIAWRHSGGDIMFNLNYFFIILLSCSVVSQARTMDEQIHSLENKIYAAGEYSVAPVFNHPFSADEIGFYKVIRMMYQALKLRVPESNYSRITDKNGSRYEQVSPVQAIVDLKSQLDSILALVEFGGLTDDLMEDLQAGVETEVNGQLINLYFYRSEDFSDETHRYSRLRITLKNGQLVWAHKDVLRRKLDFSFNQGFESSEDYHFVSYYLISPILNRVSHSLLAIIELSETKEQAIDNFVTFILTKFKQEFDENALKEQFQTLFSNLSLDEMKRVIEYSTDPTDPNQLRDYIDYVDDFTPFLFSRNVRSSSLPIRGLALGADLFVYAEYVPIILPIVSASFIVLLPPLASLHLAEIYRDWDKHQQEKEDIRSLLNLPE